MPTIADIEDSIRTLPPHEYLKLVDWMCIRHLDVLTSEGFESADLEDEMLKGIEGPRHLVDDAFYEDIRQGWKKSGQ